MVYSFESISLSSCFLLHWAKDFYLTDIIPFIYCGLDFSPIHFCISSTILSWSSFVSLVLKSRSSSLFVLKIFFILKSVTQFLHFLFQVCQAEHVMPVFFLEELHISVQYIKYGKLPYSFSQIPHVHVKSLLQKFYNSEPKRKDCTLITY